MDEQKNDNEQVRQVEPAKPAGNLIRIKPFAFIMVLFHQRV